MTFEASFAQAALVSNECCFLPTISGTGLTEIVEEVGLEFFADCLQEIPGVIEQLLERRTLGALQEVALASAKGFRIVFLGEDLAFKSGPLFAPSWLRRAVFPRLQRIVDRAHQLEVRVLFHCDGDLSRLLEDLVQTGIDALNPLEGVSVRELARWHRQFPHLLFAGAIDGSWLLPFGTPTSIRDAVRRVIAATDGRMLVGSTTEISSAIPLASFMAMREAALEYQA
jgi:uroporphyrinogen decarboxylase